jgi:hypothetical protein
VGVDRCPLGHHSMSPCRKVMDGEATDNVNCWGVSENPDKIPEHKRRMYANVQVKVTDDVRGDKGSPKDCSCLKSCESFYTCPRAPFYREIKGLYIPKTPSNSKNIPSVNMYTNVFYILYIYKPATSSHAKPRLLRRRL